MELWNFLISSLTLIVLVFYAYYTYKMTKHIEEQNLRPVVLRSGFIESWDKVDFVLEEVKTDISGAKIISRGEPLKFEVYKNIAVDIEGYFIKNNKKFKLLFGNQISQVLASGKYDAYITYFTYKWGWLAPGSVIYAIFDSNNYEMTSEDDGIFLIYRDITGNKYHTREDVNFTQTSGRI